MYFHYSFQETRPGELFISASRRPEFFGDSDSISGGKVLYFDVDGTLRIRDYVSNPNGVGSKLVGEETRKVDVSRNWEPYPEFGDYAGLGARDRGSPWLAYVPPAQG
ncbi:MAG: hypothetical protein DWQ37_23350 [Planctomycetota bacterium]|nr:MAG: hypothetical protein DWQ37_23350 [Planctomycetota bacterium]